MAHEEDEKQEEEKVFKCNIRISRKNVSNLANNISIYK